MTMHRTLEETRQAVRDSVVAKIIYYGEDIEPTPMHNLPKEIEDALAFLKDPWCPRVCHPALKRYIEKATKLLNDLQSGAAE